MGRASQTLRSRAVARNLTHLVIDAPPGRERTIRGTSTALFRAHFGGLQPNGGRALDGLVQALGLKPHQHLAVDLQRGQAAFARQRAVTRACPGVFVDVTFRGVDSLGDEVAPSLRAARATLGGVEDHFDFAASCVELLRRVLRLLARSLELRRPRDDDRRILRRLGGVARWRLRTTLRARESLARAPVG